MTQARMVGLASTFPSMMIRAKKTLSQGPFPESLCAHSDTLCTAAVLHIMQLTWSHLCQI